MLDGKVAQGQGHRVSREDVVAAEDMLPVDGQAAARDDGEHPLHVHHRSCLVLGSLGHAGVRLVSLGEHGDAHGEGSIVVEQSKDEPDAAEDDGAVRVQHDDEDCQKGVGHEDHLGHVQAPVLVLDVIKEEIWQRLRLRNSLVGEGKAGGGGEEASAEEYCCEESFEGFARNPAGPVLLLVLLVLPRAGAGHVQLHRAREGGVEGGFVLLAVGGEEGLRSRRVGPVCGVPRLDNVDTRRAAIRAVVAISAPQPGKQLLIICNCKLAHKLI